MLLGLNVLLLLIVLTSEVMKKMLMMLINLAGCLWQSHCQRHQHVAEAAHSFSQLPPPQRAVWGLLCHGSRSLSKLPDGMAVLLAYHLGQLAADVCVPEG